jgi:DNA-binding NarL/FixJ family response regulator
MREGLGRLIDDECDLMVTSSAATVAELRAIITRDPPDIVVMELMLADHDGLALIRDLLVVKPDLRIVVFTSQPDEVYAARCMRAGARGYVSKREAVIVLLRAIREIAAGGIIVPARVSHEMFTAEESPKRTAVGIAAQLTDRELQVFRLAGLAQPTRVIAEKLGVSVKTVEAHRGNIKNKLDLDSHAELVVRAAQWLRENRA